MTSATSAPYPSVLRMATPLIVSFVMRAAFTLVDTVYAATIGDVAVAGIGLAVPFEFAMIAVWVGLSTGLTSCLSRAMGAREGAKIEQYRRACWVLVWIASPGFLVLGGFIWFASFQGDLPDDVYQSFRVYGTVLIAGSAFTAFWSVIPDSVVKMHQDTRSTMWAGIWSNVVNVVLNTIFVFVFHWGVFGIALSTVLGRIAGLVYAIRRADEHERARVEAGTHTEPGLDPRPYWRILGLAIPSSLTFLLMSSELAVVNWLLSGTPDNTEAIAAYSIYYRVALFALNPAIAVAVAMLPYAARRIGECDLEGVRRGIRESLTLNVGYSIAIAGPVLLIGAPWIARGLGESPLTTEYTTFALRLVPLVCLLGGPFLIFRPVFEAMGRGRPGLVVAVFRYLVLSIPLAWGAMWLAPRLGQPPLYGVLVALLVVGALTSAAFWVWVRAALPGACEEGRVPAEFTPQPRRRRPEPA